MCVFAPIGIKMNFQWRSCVLKPKQNIHGINYGGRTCHNRCSEVLADVGFKPSNSDQYAFLRGDAIIVCYVGNCIMFAKDKMMVKNIHDQL